MKILIAPNAFKNSLSAGESASAICAGFTESDLDCECMELPIADGGDGSLIVIAKYLEATIRSAHVKDPSGKMVSANFGWNDKEKIAIVEMAEASGMKLLNNKSHHIMSATTFGTGELILEALELGAKKIYLTLGGSATVDGALGILDALGAVIKGQDGVIIANPQPADFSLVSDVDVNAVKLKMRDTELVILCDVNNPLVGEEGAARIFGPQKGASDDDVLTLEEGLARLAEVIGRKHKKDIQGMEHGGAAGGIAAILHGLLGAKLVDGAKQILEWAEFDTHLTAANLVITAEGRIDKQTDYGKGPGLVAKRAKEAGKITIGLSGGVSANDMRYANFDMVLPIIDSPGDMNVAFAKTSKNLKRTAFQLGNFLHAYDFLGSESKD